MERTIYAIIFLITFPTFVIAGTNHSSLQNDKDQISKIVLDATSKALSTGESFLKVDLFHFVSDNTYASVSVFETSYKHSCTFSLNKVMDATLQNTTWVIDKQICK